MNEFKIVILSFFCWTIHLSLFGQTITPHTTFHSTKAQSVVNVEDDLYLRFDMGKSFEAIAQERGIENPEKIYGQVKIYLEELEVSTGTIALAESHMMALQEFDLVFSVVMKQFHSLAMEHKAAWTVKDDLLINAIAQPNNTMNAWMKAIAARAIDEQSHAVKVELYLIDDIQQPEQIGAAVCTGKFSLKVKKNALQPLYGTKIPVLHRPTPDQGITSDLHQKNLGKMLWSTAFIEEKEPSTKALQTDFKVSEKTVIHGRVYLPKSIRNIGAGVGQDKICTVVATYYIDDVLIETIDYPLEASICQKATTLPLFLGEETTKDKMPNTLTAPFVNWLDQLEAGKHEIKVVLNFDYQETGKKIRQPLATSKFTIVI
ncbi:hypothetical protein [Aureispira anguillae]|uniref:Uncharacterized protein n=1 Tax=Aureispira anguillae TaxID=2864201 RepID=A0A915YF97_9BACT|nr:hypothetical protein [Aureispira anguillae]BDS11926.1 hypothetical protein AsAng_0026400 [Aureispira anguillae]